MSRELTDKQKKVLDLVSKNIALNDAVLEIYDCQDIKSAYQIAFKLKNNEVFKNELNNRVEIKNAIVESETKKLVQILEEIFPKRERMEILVKLARRESDGRLVLEAIKEVNRLDNAYPDQKIGLYRDLEREREMILTEADLLNLKEAETKSLPIIEEGEIIENSGEKENEDNNHSN